MEKEKRNLYRFLKKHHKGRRNAIITKQLIYNVGGDVNTIRKLVSELRKDGFPICSCNEGYFYPEGVSEVFDTVTRFNKYMVTLSSTSAGLLRSSVRI